MGLELKPLGSLSTFEQEFPGAWSLCVLKLPGNSDIASITGTHSYTLQSVFKSYLYNCNDDHPFATSYI